MKSILLFVTVILTSCFEKQLQPVDNNKFYFEYWKGEDYNSNNGIFRRNYEAIDVEINEDNTIITLNSEEIKSIIKISKCKRYN